MQRDELLAYLREEITKRSNSFAMYGRMMSKTEIAFKEGEISAFVTIAQKMSNPPAAPQGPSAPLSPDENSFSMLDVEDFEEEII